MIVKLQNHWRNDLRRWPHSSTFTYRHILFHKTLLLDIFFTLAASILRQSLIQTSKKFSSSYFFIFSFRSSEEVKCSPKQTSLIPLSFFILPWNYYKNTFRYLSYGKPSPAKLTDSVCRQFCSTKIFPVVIISFSWHVWS